MRELHKIGPRFEALYDRDETADWFVRARENNCVWEIARDLSERQLLDPRSVERNNLTTAIPFTDCGPVVLHVVLTVGFA